MTKVDIISGFLGAGKTTLIKKLISEALQGQQVVLIENEFGEIGIDGGFLKDAGIEIKEMSSGCICCSLVGDFETSLKEIMSKFTPDRIIIEPSGVGKLSDVARAVRVLNDDTNVEFNSAVAVVDASKAKMYSKNFGEFYNDQVTTAGTIILSRTGKMKEEKIQQAYELLRGLNPTAQIITTPWDQINGEQILAAMENETDSMAAELLKEVEEAHEHHHHHHDDEECSCGHHHHHDDDDEEGEEHEHHHHDDDEEECSCGHHHHHDDDDEDEEHEHHHHHHDDDDEDEEHEHHHHHHDDDDEDEAHEHHHHHDDDEECGCGHHHHDDDDEEEEEHGHHHHHDGECGCGHHHHHHHADEIFASIGFETIKKFTKEQIEEKLKALDDEETYGTVLRSKGMVANAEGDAWIHFDYVPEEMEIRDGSADVIGKIVVIGSHVKEDAVKALFQD